MKVIIFGTEQGFILRSDHWNLSYDEILSIEIVEDRHLVGYVDDLAATTLVRNMEADPNQELNSNIENHGLEPAKNKIKIILLR